MVCVFYCVLCHFPGVPEHLSSHAKCQMTNAFCAMKMQRSVPQKKEHTVVSYVTYNKGMNIPTLSEL